MKKSNFFYIAWFGLLGLAMIPFLVSEIKVNWYVITGLVITMIPTVVLLIHFETKEDKIKHTENCKCTCGNCCEILNNNEVQH